jgi:hypothetical protein
MFISVLQTSAVIAGLSVMVHLWWPRLVIFASDFERPQRLALQNLSLNTCYGIIIVAAAINVPAVFIMEPSGAFAISQSACYLAFAFTHLRTARLTVRFIKNEKKLSTQSVIVRE